LEVLFTRFLHLNASRYDSPLPFSVAGIDVSKATLAVCYLVNEQTKHLGVSNSKAGFQQLVKA